MAIKKSTKDWKSSALNTSINESLAENPRFLAAVERAKSHGYTVGIPESEHKFVSGNTYWKVNSATHNGVTYIVGDKVGAELNDEPRSKTYKGVIEWLMIDDTGSVQVSISNNEIGRIDVEDIFKTK